MATSAPAALPAPPPPIAQEPAPETDVGEKPQQQCQLGRLLEQHGGKLLLAVVVVVVLIMMNHSQWCNLSNRQCAWWKNLGNRWGVPNYSNRVPVRMHA